MRDIEAAQRDPDCRPVDHDRPIVVSQRAHTMKRRAPHPVTHEHVALGFYTAGTATFEQRGQWTLEAGDVMLVPAGEPHRFLEANQVEQWGLGLCATCFMREETGHLLRAFDRVRAGASAVVRIPEGRRAFLESLFVELQRETARADGGSLAVQRSLITLILAEVDRAATWPEEASAPDVVTEALRYIQDRCLAPLSLGDVARAVRRSPAHLTTLLRKTTGRSVGAWIVAHRLAEARHRLLHTDEIVEVVAERVGYRDPTHFIRMFRREHGLTPSAWREKHRVR
ncbi:DNA-binding response regulator, AraC family protein [Minicystis rosea]|nr:DNA-binding response regulator, AraC family protein [Minicystis rosea]